ncbi:hypothetical protein AB0I28_22820 [Phytomonospora sp. NPDC050363]|uniref:hypothetical protein n=1 Tax=Phytomonospora sp. NPDC050363 TaxID=3155642 RepID=UPI0033FB1E30
MNRTTIDMLAEKSGLGAVGRLHRIRDKALIGVSVGIAFPALICVFVLDDPIAATVAFVAALLPIWALIALPRLGVSAKDFIAVCDKGVLVGDRYLGVTSITWPRIIYPIEKGDPLSPMAMKFLYAEPDGSPGLVAFNDHADAFTLTLELADRRPVPKVRGGSVVGAAVVGAVAVALALVAVVPKYAGLGAAADAAPFPSASAPGRHAMERLGGMCVSPGPQPGTAAYQGKGPHGIVFFEGGPAWTPSDNEELTRLADGWAAVSPAEAELIVCTTISTGAEVAECGAGENTYDVLEADYAFRVHEAATGSLVGEFAQVATAHECSTGSGLGAAHPAVLTPAVVFDLFDEWVLGDVG